MKAVSARRTEKAAHRNPGAAAGMAGIWPGGVVGVWPGSPPGYELIAFSL